MLMMIAVQLLVLVCGFVGSTLSVHLNICGLFFQRHLQGSLYCLPLVFLCHEDKSSTDTKTSALSFCGLGYRKDALSFRY
jgi:hypothetical protein